MSVVNFCQAARRGPQKIVIFMFICSSLNFAVSSSKLGPVESNGIIITEYRKKERNMEENGREGNHAIPQSRQCLARPVFEPDTSRTQVRRVD